jgi:hypothetical protein
MKWIKENPLKFVSTAVLLGAVYLHFDVNSTVHVPVETDQRLKLAPQQTTTDTDAFVHLAHTITPLYNFDLTAKVLGTKTYTRDASSHLSTFDLALGWQYMAEKTTLEQLNISQSGRWYRWQTKSREHDINIKQASLTSANMHMIHANEHIFETLSQIDEGDVVRIRGYLVKIKGDSFRWHSSTTRSDTGAGACEVFFVTHVNIENY